jgi:hypothetical protein
MLCAMTREGEACRADITPIAQLALPGFELSDDGRGEFPLLGRE